MWSLDDADVYSRVRRRKQDVLLLASHVSILWLLKCFDTILVLMSY